MSVPGPMELALILLIVVVVFGAKKIPELGQALGKGLREFRKAIQDPQSPSHSDATEPSLNQAIEANRVSSQPTAVEPSHSKTPYNSSDSSA